MKLREIADRINEHLHRFDADPALNQPKEGSNIPPYYCAYAGVAGSYVRVTYVSFQGGTNLRKSDAEEYLRWLDAGNVGKHYKALSFAERMKNQVGFNDF
jgi:hypothetical protein